MTKRFLHCRGLIGKLLLLLLWGFAAPRSADATDYFLTIAGGYEPEGNQASLEANVVFFQQVLAEQHRGRRRHDIYFADGIDPAPDLQILADKTAPSTTPATDLLAVLHRQSDDDEHVAYRNHRVPQINGPLDPALIRASLESLAKTAYAGDRLIVYVTAHGSEGPEKDVYNTTIDCWNDRRITAREFAGWLNRVPPNIPVIMVMAQCHCGGFARTMFDELEPKKGMPSQLRVGFFAQRHDLPAAGCRPDIEHDEEFSSYFWGAFAGRSRNGVPITGCDIDGSGNVSFAEAYAHAVVAGETIDIPLRTSEVFARSYSRLKAEETKEGALANEQPEQPALTTMNGTLQSFIDRGRPVSGRMVEQLSTKLGFKLQDDVTVVTTAFEEHRRAGRGQGRGRGRRQSSGRRDLLREVEGKWPELADEDKWRESSLLESSNQLKLLAELKQLPSWKAYEERMKQRALAAKHAEQHELREVKFRRLINALESIVLEKNLPFLAAPDIVARYKQIVALEESTLSPAGRK